MIAQTHAGHVQCKLEWSSVVDKDVAHCCLGDYHTALQWSEPPICAVCEMYHDTYGTVSLSNKLGDYNLDLIHLVNLFIVQHWIIQSLSSCFSFGHSLIDRLMLEKSGV